MKYNEEIKDLVYCYGFELKNDIDKNIEWDLNLTGDDAEEFLEEYAKRFNVDMSQFQIQKYFHSEPMNFLFWIKKIVGIRNKEKLTFRDLLNGIEQGKLF